MTNDDLLHVAVLKETGLPTALQSAEIIDRLDKRVAKLDALEAAGVDNWEGYSEALRPMGLGEEDEA